MQCREPFFALGDHFAIDLPGARAVFTTRRGGVSSGPYESLNLGFLTDDLQEAVRQNRSEAERALGAPALSFVHQVHGTDVRRITAETTQPDRLPQADGQVTDRRDLAPVALVADCLPVAVSDGGAVAMLHAGWRGLAGGVLANGVEAVRALGGTGPMSAAIGPGAGPCCYEVGAEVHREFAGLPDAHHGENLDLKSIAHHQLAAAGVTVIDDLGVCTICSEPGLLFSHRRDHGVTGRQAGAAWLI